MSSRTRFFPYTRKKGGQSRSRREVAMSPVTEDGGPGQVAKENDGGQLCSHLVQGMSSPGLRKGLYRLKGDEKICCDTNPCDSNDEDSALAKWMCLQCGHIGCGNKSGKGGHAQSHQETPTSDSECHSLAVLFEGNLDKAWCFDCQVEMDTNSPFFKDCVPFVRRQLRVKGVLSQQVIAPPAPTITLGPPPPPPIPKINPPKPFTKTKVKQYGSKISSTVSNSRWDRSDWPLGLDNLGNTCFMNSALQCLSRTRSLNDKLDLYGSGNTIEILVTSDEPYVQIVNNDVGSDEESDFVSDECERFMQRGLENSKSVGAGDSSDLGNGDGDFSPSSTEMDSLLDAVGVISSEESDSGSASGGDSVEKEKWTQEMEQELSKPLSLRLAISKDSMASKLRHCFKAITRSSDASVDDDGYDQSESYFRSNQFPSVFCPRAVQMSVSRHFRLGQQHDSHELLRTVVDMMKKDQIKAFRLAIMRRYGVKKSEGKNCAPKIAELLKMWDRKLYHKTFVDEIFGGELVTFQECLQCKSIKRSHEEFLDISLPIRVFRTNSNLTKKSYSLFDDDNNSVINRSVEECLQAYTEPEFLTGSNVVECENCHRVNLERLANGATYEEVFPGISPDSEPSSSSKSQNKYQQKKQNKKRQTRQAKLKSKEDQDLCSESTLNMIEDHFTNDRTNMVGKMRDGGPEEDSKSTESEGPEGFVVVQSGMKQERLEVGGKSGHTEVDADFDMPDLDPYPATITDLEVCRPREDLYDEPMESNDLNVDDYMDDLDEPAVDGIANTSDIEDEEGHGHGPPCLDLGLEEKPISVAEYLTVPGPSGTADEGYSEGETSSDGKPLQSSSGSSSRNSISEVDNAVDSNSGVKTVKKIAVTKCPCTRRQLISRPPECLTLHLKRFQHNLRGSSKLSDRVSFPSILNLTKFCSEVAENVNKPGYKSIYDEDGEVMYSLYGIVEHSGSLHFGHYVAYVKVAGKKTESEAGDDSWFYISDSHVTQSSLNEVLSQNAYILFYERIRGEEKKQRLSETVADEKFVSDHSMSSWNHNSDYSTATSTATAVVSGPHWEENWEDASSQQVSSTNDNVDMACDATANCHGTITSSSQFYFVPLGPEPDGDAVTSSSDPCSVNMNCNDNDIDTTVPTDEDETEVDEEALRRQNQILAVLYSSDNAKVVGNDLMDETSSPNPVSSSSDARSCGHSTLEEVD